MRIGQLSENHAKDCEEQLILFAINTGDCIHVELYCDKCGKRYVYDIYNMNEI